jgi:catechol 2,3-dioxygenase-like lactoylglutathione lyase family enzyme
MTLSMRRIVLFTKNMPGMTAFYRDVLGLKLRKDEKGWKEFDANGCVIALHNGTSQVGRRPPKIGFWAKDIAAARQELVGRQALQAHGGRRTGPLRGQGPRRQPLLDFGSSLITLQKWPN